MWGGSEDCRNICWVKLEVVCRAREDGGLGIRNMKAFNLSLLRKWRWRFLKEKDSLWAKILRIRYGEPFSWRDKWSEKSKMGRRALFGGGILAELIGLNHQKRDGSLIIFPKRLGVGHAHHSGTTDGHPSSHYQLFFVDYIIFLSKRRLLSHKQALGKMVFGVGICHGGKICSFGNKTY